MKPVNVTVVGVADSAAIPLDIYIAPFQVSVGVVVASGAVSYSLQYTYDDPWGSGGITNWFTHPLMSTLTAAGDAVINGGPVTAVRLTNNDTGTIAARIIQAGISGQ